MLPARRWKRSLQLSTCRWDAMEALYRRQTKTYLPIFKCLQAKRATRQRRPLLQLKTKRLMLPACYWKRSLQLGICKWDAMEALYRRQTKYLFANLEVFTSGKGDKAMLPSLTLENGAIDASSMLVEALCATRYMEMGCNGSTLPMANKNLFANV